MSIHPVHILFLLFGVGAAVRSQQAKRSETCRHFPSSDICGAAYDDGDAQARVTWQPVQRPVLFIPGIGGSILFATSDADGTEHDAWPEYHGDGNDCDKEPSVPNVFRYNPADDGACLAARYLPLRHWNTTTRQFDDLVGGRWTTAARTLNYGLCGVDSLNPNLWVDESATFYFRHMLKHFACDLGYEEGSTLWAFPYDWRFGPYASETLAALEKQLRLIACGGADESACGTVDVVTHSMGGLLFQELVQNNSAVHRLVNSWTAIGTPFKGAGKVANAFVQGYNFDASPAVYNKTAHHLMMDWPASYALLPNQFASWEAAPFVSVANASARAAAVFAVDSDATGYYSFLRDVNAENHIAYTFSNEVVEFDNVFNERLFADAIEHQQRAETWQGTLPFNVVLVAGSGLPTPHSFSYADLLVTHSSGFMGSEPSQIEFVDGDGTVAKESAHGFSGSATLWSKWTVYGASHTDLVTSSRLDVILESSVGVACVWSGEWTATDTRSTVVRFDFDYPPDNTHPSNYYVDAVRNLAMSMSADCMTISTNGTFSLNRSIGSECSPRQERMCSNGGHQRCSYGYWAACTEAPTPTTPPPVCASSTIAALIQCPDCTKTCDCDLAQLRLTCLYSIDDGACSALQQAIATLQMSLSTSGCLSETPSPTSPSLPPLSPSPSTQYSPPLSPSPKLFGLDSNSLIFVGSIIGCVCLCCVVASVAVIVVCRRQRRTNIRAPEDAAPLLAPTD
jgi:hypothetical protein